MTQYVNRNHEGKKCGKNAKDVAVQKARQWNVEEVLRFLLEEGERGAAKLREARRRVGEWFRMHGAPLLWLEAMVKNIKYNE